MPAVTVPVFGGPEVLTVAERAVREPGAGEVRIAVAAAAVNPTDLIVRSGAVAASYAHLEPPYVPGMDAAGVEDTEALMHLRDLASTGVLPLTVAAGPSRPNARPTPTAAWTRAASAAVC